MVEQPKKQEEQKDQTQEEKEKFEEELQKAKAELQNAREKVKEVKNKYTVKGCKVKVNKIYSTLYNRDDLNETQKIKEFWRQVENLKKQYVGE